MMEEEWINHFRLSISKCYQMKFSEYDDCIRRFKVIGLSGEYRKVRDLDTGEEFEFYRNNLLKIDYSTLIEIDCENLN
jgi:hypothetical protein